MCSKYYSKLCSILIYVLIINTVVAQKNAIPKPVFDDPIYHGAADPVIIFNKEKKVWWMFYTNRRATIEDSTVLWVHGSLIGIAESKDGVRWKYKDTANINYRPDSGYTFWAPEIIANKGIYHMYLSYIPGTYTHWNHPAYIIHLTSKNLMNWQYQSTLPLSSNKVIDPNVLQLPDGTWRMWYNNGAVGKTMYYADSKDLYTWQDKGKDKTIGRGEGPKVFKWKQQYFMIVDCWKGMDVYTSDDLITWKKQAERILELPGIGNDDQAMGGHSDVVINGNRAFVYYFTHPGRRKDTPAPKNSFNDKRSVIQVAELHLNNGVITCNRDEAIDFKLK
ncbi:MAG: family 43 glycosylhydrolase [Bacteroidetes bacterium]|nr:family 43 glycosylhydrolase [Bacteroidota bacterium]